MCARVVTHRVLGEGGGVVPFYQPVAIQGLGGSISYVSFKYYINTIV